MSKTVAFIQARLSSSRFPGKVLQALDGQPMIVYMARRAARARSLDEVIVVTSNDPSDDALVTALEKAAVPFYRGDLNDVLRRYADAARACDASVIVRLTGDCPLIDPDLIDAVVDARHAADADYASNVDPPTFPDGMDVECFTRALLERADQDARPGPEREHVTLWMRDGATGARRVNHRASDDRSNLRLTVDYPDDLDVIRRVVAALAPGQPFGLPDILRVLERSPQIQSMNPHARNEGLTISLAKASKGGTA